MMHAHDCFTLTVVGRSTVAIAYRMEQSPRNGSAAARGQQIVICYAPMVFPRCRLFAA